MHEKICIQIAADMFGGDARLLDAGLVHELEEVDDLIKGTNSTTHSDFTSQVGLLNREVVAMIVSNWMHKNTRSSPYHWGG